MTENPMGSLWRRWDLHLHAPGTKLNNAFGDPTDDAVWDRYLDALKNSPVTVFGITDYFCCDTFFEVEQRYRSKYPDSKRIFLPNLELRLSESISKDGGHPHIHVIFEMGDGLCDQDKIARFLTNLETQNIDNADTKLRCTDLKTEADFAAATVSLDALKSALTATFGETRPYLVAFPANNDGLRSTDTSSPRKVALADRIDRNCDFFFGTEKNRDFLLRTDRYEKGESAPKPVVSGSDAHSFDDLERLSGDVSGFAPTWIKADATFSGLRQICHEPLSRVHIGASPEVMVRQQQDQTKFLSRLQISQIDGYDERNGQWFKNVELPLNPELTAIIGNKGSGKSALVDILGLLGDSRQEAYFSFLTDQSKSKKFRQRGFAENFSASVQWLSGTSAEKLLSDPCNKERPETVRYLPQNYFEQLTNDIEIEQFRREIEDVVFSHVDLTETLGKSSFGELEEAKTLQSKQEVSSLKQRLRELNIEIVRLEEQSAPKYRRTLLAQIEEKKAELASLDAAKPKEVIKPDTDDPAQSALSKKVDELTALLSELNERGQKIVSEIAGLKTRRQEAVSLRESISGIATRFREEIAELQPQIAQVGLQPNALISLTTDLEPLDGKIAEIKARIDALEKSSVPSFEATTDYGAFETLPDLRAAYAHVNGEIEVLKEQLGTPQRRYQTYVERLTEWTGKRQAIAGNSDDPKPGTLAHLKASLTYVDETLAGRLDHKRSERQEIVREIFQSKHHVLQFYSDLKKSVEARLEAVRSEGFEIEIDASFIVDREFRREFLNLINQRKKGPFRNDADARQELGRRLRDTDWNDPAAVIEFCEGILAVMRHPEGPDGEELALVDQAHDVKDVYDYLFSLDYLSSRYELRLGGKNLNELSPGEKGLLLLIFYLQLDRKNTPLIIDQPEDNLDNDSIFKVLAKCIRDAKRYRQVVLVTHNPNLAVGADAEQIIYVKLEKSKNYKFSYETGSIENPKLNQRIVDVLEGSQPAFVKRRIKYGIN
ncbi:TrlF family AAA-like ATPase [Sphingobium sp.]|uniref:TrlF family AAA-like ATPase n=1 Tax=Sphingobium sp. TaxID=1912891 RepID=UPI002D7E993B|nr:AAA family ATPase [Sphingobium sp.]